MASTPEFYTEPKKEEKKKSSKKKGYAGSADKEKETE